MRLFWLIFHSQVFLKLVYYIASLIKSIFRLLPSSALLNRRNCGFAIFFLVVSVFVDLSQTLALLFCKWLLTKSAFFVCVVHHALLLFKYLHRHRPLDKIVVRRLYVASIVVSEHLSYLFVESVEFNLVYLQSLNIVLYCFQSTLILGGK